MNIYILCSIKSGGSYKYILDLLPNYEKHFFIKNRKELKELLPKIKNDILLLQNIIGYDFTFDYLVNFIKKYNIKLIIPIHDFYFIYTYYGNIINIKSLLDIHKIPTLPPNNRIDNKLNIELFKTANQIIFPSNFMYNIFRHFFINDNMIIKYHDDTINYDKNTIIPKINNNINIGIIHHVNKIKGEEVYLGLINKPYNFHIFGKANKYKFNKKNVFLHGIYKEDEIYSLLIKNNIHGLLYLSNTPESYCYALTKGINSKLPILYNDIGAIGERLELYQNNRFIKYDNNFEEFINYIKENQTIN